MKSAKSMFARIFSACAVALFLTACPTTTTVVVATCGNATISPASNLITTTSTNSIPVYVADSTTTGAVNYANEPLVSVTICTPNHTLASQCTTISNILLDTGSFGLRVFATAVGAGPVFTPQMVNVLGASFQVGECQEFGTGADWGSVQMADVILGNQTAQAISIQLINDPAVPMPAACAALGPDVDPCLSGYNGIIGVGMFAQDCGADCASTDTSINGGPQYYACFSESCFNTYNSIACAGSVCAVPVPVGEQVVNPITQFGAGFNNGLSLTFPTVAPLGASGIVGSLTFGIGVAAGNVPPGIIDVYNADSAGMTDFNISTFQTLFNSFTYGKTSGTQAFLDSGSNGLFFPAPTGLPACSDEPDFYCPAGPTLFSATILDYAGTGSGNSIGFTIDNADALISSQQTALPELGGNINSVFDWGLPFFYGRTTYVGFDKQSAPFSSAPGGVASGPYWAFF